LRAAAERLAGIFPVRAVVMGHSHVRVDEPLRGGARYLNLGSWTPGCMGLSHLVVVGEEAELRSFVYKPIAQPGPQAPPGLEPRAA
jgi:UDP-2,3-diacylglucosamine pyrophosphatase LpxH